jgi:heme oxygenase
MRIDQIRQSLGPIHAAIEQTPLAKSMIGATVDRIDYCRAMAQMGIIHAALEQALGETNHPIYRPDDMARATIIATDLANLGYDGPIEPTESTARLVNQFEAWSIESPWKLIGALYVLEGSRMGSMALVRPVAKALGVEVRPGTGVDYHLDGMATRPQAWGRFKAELAATVLTLEQDDEIADAAVVTMSGLYSLYAGAEVSADVAI